MKYSHCYYATDAYLTAVEIFICEIAEQCQSPIKQSGSLLQYVHLHKWRLYFHA